MVGTALVGLSKGSTKSLFCKCLDEGFHAISPPTPTISDFSSGDRRYGRNSRTPVSKKSTQVKGGTPDNSKTLGSPKIKKGGKAKKGDRPKMPKLDAPLSELTQDYKHIPVRDMEKWVNRSAEIRRREVEGRKGYVTRPMNSFMLYRSAYAERTKFWCSQNNHQVVSSVSGESWPLEPPDIRDRYNEYARIERDNHQKAHPGYKFSPSKAQNTGQKKKDLSEESEIEEGSENDEVDSEWRPATRRHENTRDRREASVKTAAKTLPTIEDRPRGLYHISSYQAANPGKPLPTAMNEHSLYGQYLETSVVPNSDMPSTEDVHIRRTHYGNPHVGLPGGTHSELLDQHQVGYDVGIGSDGVYISNPMLHSDDNDYMFNDTLIQEQQPRGYTNAFLVDQRIPSCGPEDVIDYSQAVPIWQDQSYNSTHDDEEYAWFESNGNR